MAMARRRERFFHTKSRFPERTKEKGWVGPVVDYKEIELLRKLMTNSNKMMSRQRAGTSVAEKRAVKQAIRQPRVVGLIRYR